MNSKSLFDYENLTYVGKAINFDTHLLELITHFRQTEADARLSDLIVDIIWYEPIDQKIEPKNKIKKNLVDVVTILEDIDYEIPKELENGFVPEKEYEKQNSVLKTTFSDSSGEQYSLGIIFLGDYIVNSFIEVRLANVKHKSKKEKQRSKSKGFGKKQ